MKFSLKANHSYEIIYYTRCITRKRVTRLRGPSSRHCVRATQSPFEKRSQFVLTVRFNRTEI